MNHLVSIIVPTYNRAEIIKDTLLSIQNQSYENFECLIIDDNSTDNIEDTLRFFQNDKRFLFFRKPPGFPKGPSASRNYGISMSKGDFINFLDSDDIMLEKKLEKDLKHILSGNFDFTISQNKFFFINKNIERIYWNPNLMSSDPLNDFINKKIGWSVNAPLWKKESLLKNNLSFNEYLFTGDDYFFHIEVLQKKLKFIVYDEVTVLIRGEGKRLENFPNKTPYKLLINYTLRTESRFKINIETQEELKKRSFILVGSAFKHKDFRVGIVYSIKFLKKSQSTKEFWKFIQLIFFGIFFKLTSRGYSYLNYKQ